MSQSPMPYTAAMTGSFSAPSAVLGAQSARDFPQLAADAILRRTTPEGAPAATVRLATVAATYRTPWTADVYIAGASVAVPAVPVLGTLPDVGSTVVVLAFGASYVVLGQLGGASQGLPPGAILAHGGSTVPAGFLGCTGQGFDSTAYPALADSVQDLWAPHSGTTYYTPDLQLRHLIGHFPSAVTYGAAVGYTEGTSTAVRESRLGHRHTHTIPNQAEDPSPLPGGTGSGFSPRNAHYGGHAHGGETGLSSLDNIPAQNIHALAAVLYIIKT